MKAIYEFHWDCGRMGSVDSVFVADKAYVESMIGKDVYFGEILGKHSDVSGKLSAEDLTIKTEDQDFIRKFEEILGDRFSSGHNPLDYIQED